MLGTCSWSRKRGVASMTKAEAILSLEYHSRYVCRPLNIAEMRVHLNIPPGMVKNQFRALPCCFGPQIKSCPRLGGRYTKDKKVSLGTACLHIPYVTLMDLLLVDNFNPFTVASMTLMRRLFANIWEFWLLMHSRELESFPHSNTSYTIVLL